MGTLIDTLASQGKATDFNSRKGLYESLGLQNTYGAYTGSANQNINFMNVLQKQPSPAQVTPGKVPSSTGNVPSSTGNSGGNNSLIQALVSKGYNITDATNKANGPGAANIAKEYGVNMNTPTSGGTSISGFSDLQNKYADLMSKPQDLVALYDQYSKSTGYADAKNLITNIDKSVADIEDKIAKIEPTINQEVGNYLINDTQRGKMVTAGEQPLRTQYADILRSRARLAPELTAKAELVNTLMGYAQKGRADTESYLKTLMDIEQKNISNDMELKKFNESKSGTGSDASWIKALQGIVDKNNPPEQPKPLTSEDLGGFIKQPLSEKGKSGNVVYTTPNGVQVKWSPLDNTWVRYSADYEKKLKSLGL